MRTLNRILLLFCWAFSTYWMYPTPVQAQEILRETQLQLLLTKDVEIADKWTLSLGQRLVWNPNLEGIFFLDDKSDDPEFLEWDFVDQSLITFSSLEEDEKDDDSNNEGDPEEIEEEDDDEGENQKIGGAPTIPDDGRDPLDEKGVEEGDDNLSVWDSFRSYSQVRMRYDLGEDWEWLGGYQFSLRPQRNSHRVFSDVIWRQDLGKKWDFQARLRYQRDMSKRDLEWRNRDYVRLRNRLRYKLTKKWRSFLQNEWAYRLNQDRYFMDRTLVSTGIEYRMRRLRLRWATTYQYRLRREHNRGGFRMNLGAAIRL